MNLVFDDDDTTIVCLVDDQLVGGLKFDVFAIAPEPGHQIGASPDNSGPAGDLVEDLVNNVLGDDVEKVLTPDEVAQRAANQVEIGLCGPVNIVSPARHSTVSIRFEALLTI